MIEAIIASAAFAVASAAIGWGTVNWIVYGHPLRTPLNPDTFKKKEAPALPTPQDEIVDLVCSCLKNDRASWVESDHHLTHRALQFSIWTPNGVYGIGLNVDGKSAGPTHTCDDQNSFKMTGDQRKRLRDAVDDREVETSAMKAEKVIERVITHYERQRETT